MTYGEMVAETAAVQRRSMLMGEIKVAMNGKQIFDWDGDAEAIKNILEQFPCAMREQGVSPENAAQSCIFHMGKKAGVLHSTPAGEQMQMMGAIWFVLGLDTNNPEHPGKIAHYVATTNFEIDFDLRGTIGQKGETITAHIKAFPKFDA
jgi:hypothetical protein